MLSIRLRFEHFAHQDPTRYPVGMDLVAFPPMKVTLTMGNSLYRTLGSLFHNASFGDFRFQYRLGGHCVRLCLLVPPW